jgi:hypothetical protein
MFIGLPFNYRRSILADVENIPQNTLEHIVCKDTKLEVLKKNFFLF